MSAPRLVEQLKAGSTRHLPHVGADLRLQPGLRALPLVVGRRDPAELTTDEAKAVLDELHRLQVFYINIGGGEPMIRRDFFPLVEHAIGRGIGVKFSTNGAFIDLPRPTGSPSSTTSTSRSASTAWTPPPTTPSGARAPTPPRGGRWTTWPRPGSGPSRSRSS